MTNQVENVTENGKELSEDELYDKEWGVTDGKDQVDVSNDSSDDTSSKDNLETVDQGKAGNDVLPDGKTVAEGTQSTSKDDSSGPAEGDAEDIWKDATTAQKLAFKTAQNNLNRETGRAKSQQQRNAKLERDLLAETAKVNEATREKGEYELEHPELFNEVLGRLKAEGVKAPATAPVVSEEKIDENLRTVYSIHPDAYELTRTSEWETFKSTMTAAQKNQYNGEDPFAFSDLLSEYKTQQRIATASKTTQTPNEELSDTLTDTSGGKSVSSAPLSKGLTEDEKFDAEWAKD